MRRSNFIVKRTHYEAVRYGPVGQVQWVLENTAATLSCDSAHMHECAEVYACLTRQIMLHCKRLHLTSRQFKKRLWSQSACHWTLRPTDWRKDNARGNASHPALHRAGKSLRISYNGWPRLHVYPILASGGIQSACSGKIHSVEHSMELAPEYSRQLIVYRCPNGANTT